MQVNVNLNQTNQIINSVMLLGINVYVRSKKSPVISGKQIANRQFDWPIKMA